MCSSDLYAQNNEMEKLSVQEKNGMNLTYDELVKEYGEENAEYLYNTLCDSTKNYHKFTFIEMGVEPDSRDRKSVV